MMNRRFQFRKCAEHLIGVHDKTSGILSFSSHNPKWSALVIRT